MVIRTKPKVLIEKDRQGGKDTMCDYKSILITISCVEDYSVPLAMVKSPFMIIDKFPIKKHLHF